MLVKVKRVFYEEVWSFYQWLFLFFPGRTGHYLRGFFLKFFFKEAGKNITIKENVEIYNPQNLIMGNGSGFGRNNIIDCTGSIEIGDNVRLGPSVMIATMNHTDVAQGMKFKKKTLKKVVLKDNIWVGHNVTILPGVVIEEDCLIAAGSVVTKSFVNGSIIAGVPAKRINK